MYALLFRRQPQMDALFVRNTNGAIRGEMLMRVFEAVCCLDWTPAMATAWRRTLSDLDDYVRQPEQVAV